MSNWRPDFNPDFLYFVTSSAAKKQYIFKTDVIKRLIVDSLDCLRLGNRMNLFDFVIMPNHIHLVVQCKENDPLCNLIRDLKKHTSDRIIRYFKANNDDSMLEVLTSSVTRPGKQNHKVWDDDYLAKDIFTPEFLRQKMTYIHYNPCQTHWNLADKPEEYIWSSARFYYTSEPAIIPIDDARELFM